jgi:hypothetical protein
MKRKRIENDEKLAREHLFSSEADWRMIEEQLPEQWRQLAEQKRLIWRNAPSHIGAKISDIGQILRMIFYHVATNSSLRTTTAMASAAQMVTISAVALHKWMRKIGPYISNLLEMVTNSRQLFASERWAGYEIKLVDATVVTRPGACGTTARVHYGLKLVTLGPEQIQVTDEKTGETFRHFRAKKGELWMGDRAYASPPGIYAITRDGADVLVRYNRGSLPIYNGKGERIDVLKRLSKLKQVGRVAQWRVWVHPQAAGRIEGRLCATRLSRDKVEQARRRLRKEYGSQVTKEALKAAQYVMVFTTVPEEKLSCGQVLQLYRLRWQVELHIKRDKSIAGLSELPNFREDTIYAWICTKLLLIQLARKLSQAGLRSPLLSV